MTARASADAAAAPQPGGQIHAREVDCWRLEPHVCRACFARVVSAPLPGGGRLYQCSSCGIEAEGHRAAVVCACGIKLRKARRSGGSAATLVDAGVRCHENRRRSIEFPALFTASFGGAQADADEPQPDP